MSIKIGLAVCEALGLEAKNVGKIEIVIEPGRADVIVHEFSLVNDPDRGERLCKTLRRFALVERSKEEEASDAER